MFSYTQFGMQVAKFCARAAGDDVGHWYRSGGGRSEV